MTVRTQNQIERLKALLNRAARAATKGDDRTARRLRAKAAQARREIDLASSCNYATARA